jgi:lipopolysaccharide export system protein LptC
MRRGAAERASRTIECRRRMPPLSPEDFVRSTVVMIVLAILAAATWVFTWPTPDQAAPAERSGDLGPLGYYVRGARLSGTDEQGRVTYRLRAERLDELPAEEQLRLEGVSVEYQPAEDAAWTISATSGSVLKDGSLLELSGDVEVRSVPTTGSAPRTILTQALQFWPDTSSVQSDQPVELRVGDLQLHGTGLSADLKGHTLRLESVVHGTFLPH